MSNTNFTNVAMLNALYGDSGSFGTFTSQPDLHLAASTTTPAEDGTNITEPVGNGYARLDVANTDFGAPTNADPSVIANSALLQFAQASGSWGTITHVVLYDALTAGNPLVVFALAASKVIGDQDTLEFAIGDLTHSMD